MSAGKWSRVLGLVLVALGSSACDGESIIREPQSLKVSANSLSFSNRPEDEGAALTPNKITAEILNPSSRVYIRLTHTQNGLQGVSTHFVSNPFTIEVSPKLPAAVGIKTVTDQVLIAACEDPQCDRHIKGSPAQVDVSYTVRSRFSSRQGFSSLSYVLGDGLLPSSSLFIASLGSIDWVATANQPWIRLPKSRGQTPEPVMMELDREQGARLPVGSYQGEVTFSNPEALVENRVFPVTLQVVPPTLSLSSSELTFGGADGTELSPRTLNLSLNTGNNAYPWTATIDTGSGPQWLSLSSTSGTVSHDPFNPTQLTVSVDPTGLPHGTHTGKVTFTASVKGVTVTQTLPVSLTLVAHKLWVSDNGVGLVSTPSASKLTHTVTVKDVVGQNPAPWTASSNQPWLSVTSSDSRTLTVTANPAGLTADTLHLATVTLSPQDSSLGGDTVQVGLWVGARASNSRDTLTTTGRELEMDPIRPYVYVHDGLNLSVYNVYTASLVASLPSLGGNLGAMTLSTDGSTLYVLDQGTQIIPVKLATMTASRPWYSSSRPSSDLTYARPNGRGVVFTTEARVHDADHGSVLRVEGAYEYWRDNMSQATASVDGSVLCGRGGSLVCLDMSHPSLSDDINIRSIVLSRRGVAQAGGEGYRQIALQQDGSRVYAALRNQFRINTYDTRNMSTLPQRGGDAYVDHVAVGLDDRLYAVSHASNGPHVVGVFDDAGSSLATYTVAPAANSVVGLGVSGDGKRFVTLTNLPTLELISTP